MKESVQASVCETTVYCHTERFFKDAANSRPDPKHLWSCFFGRRSLELRGALSE